ncbi:hypothetical protein GCM10023187_22190 [Nibrella viscosa]|uniref:Uncharacterized protein n=1 Tax=Nibrella viscosa TaxID=1084524 RepID=A0ABP8KEI9_9BACT
MKKLQPDWLTQGWIDAEYKKYVVMAYLQAVKQNFSDRKLCPDLPELRRHYEAGLHFRRCKGTLNASFPKQVDQIDFKTRTVTYKSEVTDDAYLSEVDAIMDFALPRFREALTEGQHLWERIAASLTLEPIGLLPLRPNEGYLLIHHNPHSETLVYYFCLTLYDDNEPGGRIVQFRFVEKTRKSLGHTFENMKLDLVRRYRHLPNPATFMLEARRSYPVEETLLPIARQLIALRATG